MNKSYGQNVCGGDAPHGFANLKKWTEIPIKLKFNLNAPPGVIQGLRR